MTEGTFLWRTSVRVPAALIEPFEEAIEPYCLTISSFGFGPDEDPVTWQVEGFSQAEPDKEMIRHRVKRTAEALGIEAPKPQFELVPPKNWLAENFNDFPPVEIGRFYIHGSHKTDRTPYGRHAMMLDSGTAFGSGEHASTAGCLTALESLAKRFRPTNLLDMGCGSGILSLAMARLWNRPVIASDIDPESTRVTRINAKRNLLANQIKACCAPGYQSPQISRQGPYDLIVSNILANPLCKMAVDLSRNARTRREGGSTVILSGFLIRDANRVLAAHQRFGFQLVQAVDINGWRTLMLKR